MKVKTLRNKLFQMHFLFANPKHANSLNENAVLWQFLPTIVPVRLLVFEPKLAKSGKYTWQCFEEQAAIASLKACLLPGRMKRK